MSNYTYKVIMQTPIGEKHGTMRLTVNGQQIEGCLDILDKQNPFQGHVDDNKHCRFTGTVTTLMQEMKYNATGFLDEGKVDLVLQTKKLAFHLTGTQLPAVKGEPYEKIL